MSQKKDSIERGSKTVSAKGLKNLAKNGRDYSKPTLNEQLTAARESMGRKKPKVWMKIVSVPMGGMKK